MNNDELIIKFKSIENELIELLKIDLNDIDADSVESQKILKNNLKNYIETVKKVKKLFSEYESLAKKLELLSEKDEFEKIAETVVDLREKSDNCLSKIESYQTETKVVDGEVSQTKKKKSNTTKEY